MHCQQRDLVTGAVLSFIIVAITLASNQTLHAQCKWALCLSPLVQASVCSDGFLHVPQVPLEAVKGEYTCVYADAFLGEDFSLRAESMATFSAIFASTTPEARDMDEKRFCTYLKVG